IWRTRTVASLLLRWSNLRLAIVSDWLFAPAPAGRECHARCNGTAEQSALAADHLSVGDRHQPLVERGLSAAMVRPAVVRHSLRARLAVDSGLRRPEHFGHSRHAPGGNDGAAGSRYRSPRHGRPLLVYAQSTLSRRHDACTGDWTGLWHCVVLAP